VYKGVIPGNEESLLRRQPWKRIPEKRRVVINAPNLEV
jgi:hypothetical protein